MQYVRSWLLLLLIPGCADEQRSRADSAVDTSALVDIADSTGSDAAIAVIRDYYEAVERGDYARAYAHWDDQGAASGQSFDEFRSGYRSTASVDVEIGEPGRIEGAAGSRYITIPVVLTATTTAADTQCFSGTYTLVRREVTGATAAQRRWHIAAAQLTRCVPRTQADSTAAIAALVERFGARLSRVTLLAPEAELRARIRSEYGTLVTNSLLDAWLTAPSTAPGRSVSSPWPDRIEIQAVRRVRADAYEVSADIVHVTSVDAARGTATSREPVAGARIAAQLPAFVNNRIGVCASMQRKRRRHMGPKASAAIVVAVGIALLLPACGETGGDEDMAEQDTLGQDTATGGATQTTTAMLSEWSIEMQDTMSAGTWTFSVMNHGTYTHGFEVEGMGIEEAIDTIAAGQSANLSVSLQPGTYEVYCPITDEHGDHRELGMRTTLVVR